MISDFEANNGASLNYTFPDFTPLCDVNWFDESMQCANNDFVFSDMITETAAIVIGQTIAC